MGLIRYIVGCFKHKLAAIFTQSSFQTQQNIQFLLDSRSVPAYFTHQSNDADIKLFFCSYVLFRADGEKLAVVGSPFWMAPEVLRDEPYNEKVKSLLVQRRFADSDQFKSDRICFLHPSCANALLSWHHGYKQSVTCTHHEHKYHICQWYQCFEKARIGCTYLNVHNLYIIYIIYSS